MVIKALSPRQIEVAKLVAQGFTDESIANKLHISRRRVGESIFLIKEKWGIHSRVQLGIFAYRFGLLDWDEDNNQTSRRSVDIG